MSASLGCCSGSRKASVAPETDDDTPDCPIEMDDESAVVEESSTDVGPKLPQLEHGVASTQGNRPYNEDQYSVDCPLEGNAGLAVFGIYDGHRGTEAADAAKVSIPAAIANLSAPVTEQDMVTLLQTCDEEFLAENPGVSAGSTVVTLIVAESAITVANVGDARCILCRDNQTVMMTIDHTLKNASERARVTEAGGLLHGPYVGVEGTERMIAVTRAFGDRELKTDEKVVTCEPHVTSEELDDTYQFCILASDGLWHYFPIVDAVDYVQKRAGRMRASKIARLMLKSAATKRPGGLSDNVTVMIVIFRDNCPFDPKGKRGKKPKKRRKAPSDSDAGKDAEEKDEEDAEDAAAEDDEDLAENREEEEAAEESV